MKVLKSERTAEQWDEFWRDAIPSVIAPPGWKTRAELELIWKLRRSQTKTKINEMLAAGTIITQKFYSVRTDGGRNLVPYYMRKVPAEKKKSNPA